MRKKFHPLFNSPPLLVINARSLSKKGHWQFSNGIVKFLPCKLMRSMSRESSSVFILLKITVLRWSIYLKICHSLSLGGIPKSGTFCLVCFDWLSSAYSCSRIFPHFRCCNSGTLEPISGTCSNQNKLNKRFRILVSHPVLWIDGPLCGW